jgi:pre-mRNA-splicing helicase BRR2
MFDGITISELSGEVTPDLRLLETNDIILATPHQWDLVSRQSQSLAKSTQ